MDRNLRCLMEKGVNPPILCVQTKYPSLNLYIYYIKYTFILQ